MVGIIGLALAGICGLFTTPVHTDFAPGCALSPLGASANIMAETWSHSVISQLLRSLGGFVQYAEEEEEASEEEKSEDWPPEPPDRIFNSVQLA